MYYARILSRVGAVPGLVRLTAFILEVLSFMLLAFSHSPNYDWTTSYSILLYLILVDLFEIVCLCGQSRDWPISALPTLLAGDLIGLVMLLFSRDWYGLWYWHGPWYALKHEIGLGLFLALPILRFVLVFLAGCEHWYESREDQILAAERQALLNFP
ncbi:hypothetical protein VPNG_01382 [Cytospora leucostoma]|uniref:Uncharacterized protein n=1 Tax=Cytospora leucostoma TaxID=1230097 RepID=A0A423XLF6_9PEZI|nr:hypothetical protein VPNG_01382 [Cytospora leucostoma]